MMILTSLGDLLWGLRRRRIVRAITWRQVGKISTKLTTHVPNKLGNPSRLLIFGRCMYMNERQPWTPLCGLVLRESPCSGITTLLQIQPEKSLHSNDFAGLKRKVGKHLVSSYA